MSCFSIQTQKGEVLRWFGSLLLFATLKVLLRANIQKVLSVACRVSWESNCAANNNTIIWAARWLGSNWAWPLSPLEPITAHALWQHTKGAGGLACGTCERLIASQPLPRVRAPASAVITAEHSPSDSTNALKKRPKWTHFLILTLLVTLGRCLMASLSRFNPHPARFSRINIEIWGQWISLRFLFMLLVIRMAEL